MNNLGLFASPKWELIKEVATSSQSPTSLAKKLQTSIPNVLHHLRLLEAYGIITGKPAKPKRSGKPPTLYGLAKPLALIALTDKLGSKKKQITPTNKEKFFLKCLLEYDEKMSFSLIKLVLNHPDMITDESAIGISASSSNKADILLINPDIGLYRKEKSKIKIEFDSSSVDFQIWSHTKEEFHKGVEEKEDYFVKMAKSKILHDPSGILS